MVRALLYFLLVAILILAGLGVGSLVVYCLWNLIISPFFGVMELSWMQCFGAAIAIWLIKILLK